jgi:hypothetical protein
VHEPGAAVLDVAGVALQCGGHSRGTEPRPDDSRSGQAPVLVR